MSLTNCRECGENVSSKAKTCPSCGIKDPSKGKNVLHIIGNTIGAVVGAFIGLALFGFFMAVIAGIASESSSKAECKLLDNSLEADVFFIQGEPDAGYRYNVTMENVGEKGEITITAVLSTSEGVFKREQTLLFDKQEIRKLSFAFPEPTINASNIQGRLSYQP